MSESAEERGERYPLDGARVYVHVTFVGDERLVHVDVDHEELARIIPPQEASYVGGRKGGVYIGLRSHQAKRAEEFVARRPPQ